MEQGLGAQVGVPVGPAQLQRAGEWEDTLSDLKSLVRRHPRLRHQHPSAVAVVVAAAAAFLAVRNVEDDVELDVKVDGREAPPDNIAGVHREALYQSRAGRNFGADEVGRCAAVGGRGRGAVEQSLPAHERVRWAREEGGV